MSILLTNALSFVGPGVVDAMRNVGKQLIVHDPSFADPAIMEEFGQANSHAIILKAQTANEISEELARFDLQISSVIHNNALVNKPAEIEKIKLSEFQESFNELFLFPVELTQLLLPNMKTKMAGSIVFVTSARYLKPEKGFAVATSIRSGTTSFALALAAEVAQYNIQVNVVAPNFLYSETYYPRSKFIEDPSGIEYVKSQVPMGRLGEQSEIAELIAFLISGKSTFVTGQVINFTGGWPN